MFLPIFAADTLETVGVGGAIATLFTGVGVAATWLYNKWWAYREKKRAETVEDRDVRLKAEERREAAKLAAEERKEASAYAAIKESLDRVEKERERERAEWAKIREEDRKEVHAVRDQAADATYRGRLQEARTTALAARLQRAINHIKYLESVLSQKKVVVVPFADDLGLDTDHHLALPPDPQPPSPAREAD